jgi:hypothetical protein
MTRGSGGGDNDNDDNNNNVLMFQSYMLPFSLV